MKTMKKIMLVLFSSLLLFSCSSEDSGFNVGSIPQADDDNDSDIRASDLLGLWQLTDLRIDPNVDDIELTLARDILLAAVVQDCNVLSFLFSDNNTVVSESKLDYIADNITIGGGGMITVDCPDETDTENSEWTLSGSSLTIFVEGGDSETIAIILEDDNTLIISGENIDELYTGSDAVFTKQ